MPQTLKPRDADWYAHVCAEYAKWMLEGHIEGFSDTTPQDRVLAYALLLLAEEGEFFGLGETLVSGLKLYQSTSKRRNRERRERLNRNRNERDQAIRDCGLTRVRSASGKVYWE